MYQIDVTYSGQALRSLKLPTASLALKSWHNEESTGYLVTCQDQGGASVTKAQLRKVGVAP